MAATPDPPPSSTRNIMSAFPNSTFPFNAFPPDFALAIPNFLANAASFAFVRVPERIDSMLHGGGSMIAEATGNTSKHVLSAALSDSSLRSRASNTAATNARQESTEAGEGEFISFTSLFFQHLRNFGGIFAYATSKWALLCLALVFVLHRTQVFASTRRHVRLSLPLRLAIRIIPIFLFLRNTIRLLQAMRCQTSPYYSQWSAQHLKQSASEGFSGSKGFLHRLSSKMLPLESDEESCHMVKMIGIEDTRGSLYLLWPFFQTLCLAQFAEVISCAIQGRTVVNETGMTIFEHSLAFAEAEGMLGSSFGFSPFSLPKFDKTAEKDGLFTRKNLFRQLNTPPENLLMALISSLNSLSSQILGVFDKQAKYRLVNTAFWGMCFMASLTWGLFGLMSGSSQDHLGLRFPTVCVVGFIPHLLILIGIFMCTIIYTLALILCFFSPPNDVARLPLFDRLKWAHENMQANAQIASFRFNRSQDFYSALLHTGFSAMTAASEAVYLNERKKVNVAKWTWIEEQRMKELESSRTPEHPAKHSSHSSKVNTGRRIGKSGYAIQKVPHTSVTGDLKSGAEMDAVGFLRRLQRLWRASSFMGGVFWLLVDLYRVCAGIILEKLGVRRKPRWLKTARAKEFEDLQAEFGQPPESRTIDFWMLSNDGVLSRPTDLNVDVEVETKRRFTESVEEWDPPLSADQLSSGLYEWWKAGGWWGEKDSSGSYAPSVQDDEDATSIITTTTADDWEDGNAPDVGSGQTTPTNLEPFPDRSRTSSPTPDTAIDPLHLASLLDPKDLAARQEAKMLAQHLTSDHIVTRSRFRNAQRSANAKLLTSTRYRPEGLNIPPLGPLNPSEEAQLLENLVISRRSQAPASAAGSSSTSWDAGASGMGSGGPQCVICQSSPRTVLAWPCRCLSLCEDCRVSLAMNNFGTCVCCRQDVVGFSRLFVP